MSQYKRAASAPSPGVHFQLEVLERRELFAVARPDHVVVVVLQDRASDALGNPIWDYLNSIAQTGLVYTNSHGVTHPSEPNSLALYSGSTQGITDNGRHHNFSGPNLARSLFNAGLSFSGYIESLPSNGSQVAQAGDGVYPDLYTRNLNPMAQFTDIGIDPNTGLPRPNSAVNRTFGHFSSIPTNDYSSLPTVSYVIPNTLHNAHGSNAMEPWAGSPDEENNDVLRNMADNWLAANINAYLEWAKQNNSLLIMTQDEERWTGGTAQTITTLVHGDADLFNPGTNGDNVNHYNLLRTITDMYGLAPLGVTGSVAAFDTDAGGQLIPDGQQPPQTIGTSTSVSASASSTVFGQSVTFTATVTPSIGNLIPDGIVTFKDGATTIGTATLNAAGVATLTTSALSVGSHSITAVYGGSASFAGSTSSALTQSVAKASTSTALSSSLSSSVFGQSVTFTATVNVDAPGAGTAGGTVTFRDGTTVLGTVNLSGSGLASLSISSLSVAGHSITATYNGNANFNGGASSSLALTVAKASTATSVSASLASPVFGQSVTFTATVGVQSPGGGTPAGTVTFMDGTTVIGTATLNAAGQATLSTSSLAVGAHSITAVYDGNANFDGGTSSALSWAVSKASTSTTVASSANPAAPGQSVTFTATVASVAPGTGVPTDSVQFRINGVDFGAPVALVNGVATSAATSSLVAGSHAITAVYSGSGNHNGSTSATLTQTISAGAPANNSFANRTPLGGGAVVTTTGTNVGATKELLEQSHGGNSGGKSVWWTWTAPAAGNVTIDTAGSNFDTLLAVYTGSSLLTLSRVAQNDDVSGLLTSRVTFSAVAGRVYQIAVDGYAAASGNITLRIHTHAKVPSGVVATDGTFSDRVRVTWNAAVGATAYEVWRSTTSNSNNAVKLSTTDVVGTTFDDTTAVAGRTYWYFIKAKNAVSTSGFSSGNSGFRAVTSALFAAPNTGGNDLEGLISTT